MKTRIRAHISMKVAGTKLDLGRPGPSERRVGGASARRPWPHNLSTSPEWVKLPPGRSALSRIAAGPPRSSQHRSLRTVSARLAPR